MRDSQRIYNALLAWAKAGPYYPVSYSPTTDERTVSTVAVSPVGVVLNEVSSTFVPAKHWHRTRAHDRETWTWMIIADFSQEVSAEDVEEAISAKPLVLARDATHDKQITLVLANVSYEHPVRQAPEMGTHLTFTFEAEISPT